MSQESSSSSNLENLEGKLSSEDSSKTDHADCSEKIRAYQNYLATFAFNDFFLNNKGTQILKNIVTKRGPDFIPFEAWIIEYIKQKKIRPPSEGFLLPRDFYSMLKEAYPDLDSKTFFDAYESHSNDFNARLEHKTNQIQSYEEKLNSVRIKERELLFKFIGTAAVIGAIYWLASNYQTICDVVKYYAK
ncbi:hypothetical protein KY330_01790 [Candidatus Woesearchaeota archaeon]|nr:hypothetical protein [Candidatus Woesearchaeota archaeon]